MYVTNLRCCTCTWKDVLTGRCCGGSANEGCAANIGANNCPTGGSGGGAC
eukprot:TRINITY_DN2053_c0_g1_i1.p4 TRINITY_DN2053_c0_g1~~TRINITY_DN2053_c0_g1_i1.p4  ORF type:complete len:50 (+),score=4.98 TRINITY_DN2053_c0_g1_i1:250-399(+)